MTDGQSTDEFERPKGRDSEILHHVERKGPITTSRLVEAFGVWSPDEVYTSLQSLKNDGFIESQEGDIEEHGTTCRVWYVEAGTDRTGGGR